MSKLLIDDCMSPSPYTIQQEASMADAYEAMREYKIRHLPVLDGSRVVGLVSMRDLHLMQTFKDVDPSTVPVRDAMSENPYTVQIGTTLREVAINMNARKYGSAIIVDKDKIVGLFTTVDAMRALANVSDKI